MNMDNKNINIEKAKKRYLFSLVAVLTVVVAIIGATYAFFQLTATANNINGTAAKVGLDLNITKVAPIKETTDLDGLVPQYGSDIKASVDSECMDGNNLVCQVYELKLTNTGDTPINISGEISFSITGGSMPNLKWSPATLTITTNDITETVLERTDGISAFADEPEKAIGTEVQIAKGGFKNVYVVVWLEDTGAIQNDNGTFTATVTYTTTEGKGITSTIIE